MQQRHLSPFAYRRTKRDLAIRQFVLHDLSLTSYWPMSDAIALGERCGQHLIEAIGFRANEQDPAAHGWVDISTPDAATRAWASALRPPVSFTSPPFSPREILEVARAAPYEVCVRASRPSGASPTLHILVQTMHIDWRIALESTRSSLSLLFPTWAGTPVEWAFDVPAALGHALVRHHRLREAAFNAETKQDMSRMMAIADEHWISDILPLHSALDASRRLEEPAEVAMMRYASWQMDDLRQERWPHLPLATQFPSHVRIPERLRPREIYQARRRELVAIRDELIRLPDVDVDGALSWLESQEREASQSA